MTQAFSSGTRLAPRDVKPALEALSSIVGHRAVCLNPLIPLSKHIFEPAVRGPECMVDCHQNVVVVFFSAAFVGYIDVSGSRNRQMNPDLIWLALMMTVPGLGNDNSRRGDALIDLV
jgi:hypothetical protein